MIQSHGRPCDGHALVHCTVTANACVDPLPLEAGRHILACSNRGLHDDYGALRGDDLGGPAVRDKALTAAISYLWAKGCRLPATHPQQEISFEIRNCGVADPALRQLMNINCSDS